MSSEGPKRRAVHARSFARAEGLGVPGMRCDGMDVLDTYGVVCEAVRRVREERRPLLIEAVTYRFRGHSMADPAKYRSKEEVQKWMERDPINVLGQRMQTLGIASAEQLRALDDDVKAQVEDAVEFAEQSPLPAPETVTEHVYA